MDSRAEFLRFRELELMEKCKAITDLQVHPRFEITMIDRLGKPFVGAYYEADFSYFDGRGVKVVEDVKPRDPKAQTDLFKLKKKWVEKIHKLEITIIGR